jgi:hypothetical protein
MSMTANTALPTRLREPAQQQDQHRDRDQDDHETHELAYGSS